MRDQVNGKQATGATARAAPSAAGPGDMLVASHGLGAEAALRLLASLAPLRSASLWTRDAGGEPTRVCAAGEPPSPRGARALADQLLAGTSPADGAARELVGTPLGRRDDPLGAVVARARVGESERCRAALSDAAPTLTAALERDLQRAERLACERALLAAAERKLTRLGLDLHDGPMQELAALASDVHLLAGQLTPLLDDSPQRDVLRGRVEDLEAQLGALDGSLRKIAGEVQAAPAGPHPELRVALTDLVHGFAARTGVRPRLTLAGPLGALSDSQQIALLNIVAEALSNVRRHADASSVQVVVRARREGLEASISDNGRGFEADRRPRRAAREGRKGLLAIAERVRLLGGRCAIESRPGGPTCVRVMLPRWRPAPAPSTRRTRQAAASTARNGARSFSNA